MKQNTKTLIYLCLLFMILSGMFIHFFNYEGWQSDAFKALLAFGFVGIGSQALAYWIQTQKHDAEEKLRRSAFYLKLLSEITHVYSQTKSVRRLSRARSSHDYSIEPKYVIRVADYRDAVFLINELQLKCEEFDKSAQLHKFDTSNGKIGVEISKNIKRMENYLNEIVDEMEDTGLDLSSLTKAEATVKVKNLPAFSDLLGHYPNSRFRTEFVHVYHETRNHLAALTEQS